MRNVSLVEHKHSNWVLPLAMVFFIFNVALAWPSASAAEQSSEAATMQPTPGAGESKEAATTSQSMTAPEQASKVAPRYGTLPDVSGLFFQLPYVTTKLAIAITGSIIGGVTWIATGGDVTKAKVVWDATLEGPWGWPEFVRGFGRAEETGKPAGLPQG